MQHYSTYQSQFIEMFGKAYPQEAWEDCLTITNGKKYPDEYLEIGTYPICGSGGIMGYGDHKLCSKDTIILGRKGNINSPIYMETDYWIVDTAFSLDVDCKKLHPKYFYYWCVLFDFTKYNKQGVLPSLTKNDLLKIEISIPPMNEQIKFVQILDQADKSKFTSLKSQFIEMFGADTPVQKISDVCDVRGGSTPSRTNSLFWDNGDVPWFTVEDIYSQGKYIRETKQHITKLATKKCFVYPKDTVVICCTASIGECALAKIEMASNQQFNGMMIKDRNKLDPQFLLYVSSTLKDELLRQAGKTTIHFVSRNKLEEMQIPVPSMDKQQSFVAIMEQADKSKFTSLKSQFIEMFGSNDCECKPLSDLTSLITKGTTPTSVGFNFEEDGIKYIKAENICEDTSINLNDCMHISQDCHNTLKRSQLQNGDLLFSIAGVIGRVGVITKECLPANTNQALAIIRFDTSKEINKEYAKHALLSSFVESQWKMKMRGAAQMNISLKDVGDINIPLPSLANQEQFCQIAEQADKSKYIN